MLALFQSVGAGHFVLTWRNMDGKVVQLRKFWQPFYIDRMAPELLAKAARNRLNLFLRPYSDSSSLIQLDDLTDARAAELSPLCFLTLKTSPAKSQAWIAIAATGDGGEDKDFRRRVKKAAQSDPMASGSVRWAGGRNFKPAYNPEKTGETDFPLVTITHAAPGRITTRETLEGQGLVAPAAPVPLMLPARAAGPKGWPDYAKALAGAPLRMDGKARDRSLADFVWCKIAMERFGHGEHETADRLMEVSAKAKEKGRGYADETALAAAQALTRNRAGQCSR